MNKNILYSLGKFLLTYLALLFSFIIGAMIAFPEASNTSSSSESADSSESIILLWIILVITLGYFFYFLKTTIRGKKLFITIFLLYFGINTFMLQIETMFFQSAFSFSGGSIANIMLMGVVSSFLFALFASFIWRKPPTIPAMPSKKMIPKPIVIAFTLIAIAYVFIYFLFGYYVAWQSPEVRMFYTKETTLLPFFQHFAGLVKDNPIIFPFQLFRGVLWAGLALLIWRTISGTSLLKSFLIGLLFSIASVLLILPNPFMPEAIRWAHFWEVSSSNFIFGLLCGWIFSLFNVSDLFEVSDT